MLKKLSFGELLRYATDSFSSRKGGLSERPKQKPKPDRQEQDRRKYRSYDFRNMQDPH